MKVNEQFSKKIAVLSFLAMISVVYIHHKAVGNAPHVAAWNAVAQRFCTRALTDWAVPFFFVVSGFWFARSAYVVAATPGGGGILTSCAKRRGRSSCPIFSGRSSAPSS